jgi:hypothetical protein
MPETTQTWLELPATFVDAFIAHANRRDYEQTGEQVGLNLWLSDDRRRLHLCNDSPGIRTYLRVVRDEVGDAVEIVQPPLRQESGWVISATTRSLSEARVVQLDVGEEVTARLRLPDPPVDQIGNDLNRDRAVELAYGLWMLTC